MFEIGIPTAGFVNLCFGMLSIHLGHSLYRSPRRWWQCVLAWVCVLALSTVCGEILDPLLPHLTHERIQAFLGLDAILVYLYLFRNVPPAQRMFTYFMVDNSIYMVVLLSRTAAMALVRVLPLPHDTLFLGCFLLLAGAGVALFHLRLKKIILAALLSFRQQLGSLAVFAGVCYLATLLLVDTWSAWPALTLPFTLANLSIAALALSGYLLAFRTLAVLRARDTAEAESRRLAEQFVQSERYYDSMVEQIEQTRLRTHDLHHHITAISALCEGEKWEQVRSYVTNLVQEMPRGLPKRYCAIDELNAVLDYYAHQCERSAIAFDCRVELPRQTGIAPLHLCIILGNALENALEASVAVDEGERFVRVSVACAQGRVAISVTNRFAGQPKSDPDGHLRSTKQEPGHGLGLTSIRETTQRYGGWCGTQIEETIFTLQVTLECTK